MIFAFNDTDKFTYYEDNFNKNQIKATFKKIDSNSSTKKNKAQNKFVSNDPELELTINALKNSLINLKKSITDFKEYKISKNNRPHFQLYAQTKSIRKTIDNLNKTLSIWKKYNKHVHWNKQQSDVPINVKKNLIHLNKQLIKFNKKTYKLLKNNKKGQYNFSFVNY
tara:strand:+ start:614 stop:1114 length:501 start_codon:yes stop_codon:yes gene_type:complete